jgi:hypothetical protein
MKILEGAREFFNGDEKYPALKTLINKPMDNEIKEKVVKYLKEGKELAIAPSITRDILDPNVRLPRLSLMGDGEYEWRSDIAYYVEKYDLELPQEFIEHVLEKMK